MKLQVDDITAVPRDIVYAEDVLDLNARLATGAGDYRVLEGVRVAISYYRAGLDVFLSGTLSGNVQAACARCTEEFSLAVDTPFRIVLAPRSIETAGEAALGAEDLALSFFVGKEIELAPLVHEQMILALPTRPLCAGECRGLCPRCGINLNTQACACASTTTPPRLAVLHQLVRGK